METKSISRRHAWLFFLGLALTYLSLSPLAILDMGYTVENVQASNQILANLGRWMHFDFTTTPVTWPRHGLFELLFEMPFLLIGRALFSGSAISTETAADLALSIQPVLASALLCTVVFIWVRRLTGSFGSARVLALATGLSTMVWPYAYIGLETTQSLFLFLAAYLALGTERRGPGRATGFVVCCTLAVGLKSNGVFLAPAVAYLIFVYFHIHPALDHPRNAASYRKIFALVALTALGYAVSAYTRSLSPVWGSGSFTVFRQAMLADPLAPVFTALSLLVSVNKGLVFYCPITILCLLAWRDAYRSNRPVAIFAALVLGGLIGGSSLVFFWSDETWGPRYLHSAIAPLVMCLACSRRSLALSLRKNLPLAALVTLGCAVSFLGAFFYYGVMHRASLETGHGNIEAVQYEANWNHIRFNLKLLNIWMQPSSAPAASELWPPMPHWVGDPPAGWALKQVDVRALAVPQAFLVRAWNSPKTGLVGWKWTVCFACLFLGPALLVVSRSLTRARDGRLEGSRDAR